MLESWAVLAATVFFFVAVVVWGGTCYKSVQDTNGFDVRTSGFAFTIVCFFLLFAELIFMYFIRINPDYHLGATNGGLNGGMNDSLADNEAYQAADSQATASTHQHQQSYGGAHHQPIGENSLSENDIYATGSYQAPPPIDAISTKKTRVQPQW